MTQQEFREEMLAYRADAESSAAERRDTRIVLERLDRLYSSFDESERAQANSVLAEWILSDAQGLRFDARHLARVFRIGRLLDALRESATRLSASGAVGEAEEAQTVRSLIQFLQPENVVVLQPARAYAASESAAERVG
jgi:hypothetical protein